MSCKCCNHGGYVKPNVRLIGGYLYATGPVHTDVVTSICNFPLFMGQPVPPFTLEDRSQSSLYYTFNYNPPIPPQYPDPAYPTLPYWVQSGGSSVLFGVPYSTGIGSWRTRATNIYGEPYSSVSIRLSSAPVPSPTPTPIGGEFFTKADVQKVNSPCTPWFPSIGDFANNGVSTFNEKTMTFSLFIVATEVINSWIARTYLKKIVEIDVTNPYWPNIVQGSQTFSPNELFGSSQNPIYPEFWDTIGSNVYNIHYAFSVYRFGKAYNTVRGCCNWVSPGNNPGDPEPPIDPPPPEEPPAENPECCELSRWVCINGDSRLMAFDGGDETWDTSSCCFGCSPSTVRIRFTCVDNVVSMQRTYTCDEESSIDVVNISNLCDDDAPFFFSIPNSDCYIQGFITANEQDCESCISCCGESRWFCINNISKELELEDGTDTFDVTDCCDCESSILTLSLSCVPLTNLIRVDWTVTCGESLEPVSGVEFIQCSDTVLNIAVNDCFYQIQISETNIGCEACDGGITTTTPPPPL